MVDKVIVLQADRMEFARTDYHIDYRRKIAVVARIWAKAGATIVAVVQNTEKVLFLSIIPLRVNFLNPYR